MLFVDLDFAIFGIILVFSVFDGGPLFDFLLPVVP